MPDDDAGQDGAHCHGQVLEDQQQPEGRPCYSLAHHQGHARDDAVGVHAVAQAQQQQPPGSPAPMHCRLCPHALRVQVDGEMGQKENAHAGNAGVSLVAEVVSQEPDGQADQRSHQVGNHDVLAGSDLAEAEAHLEQLVHIVQEGNVLAVDQAAQHHQQPEGGAELLQIIDVYALLLILLRGRLGVRLRQLCHNHDVVVLVRQFGLLVDMRHHAGDAEADPAQADGHEERQAHTTTSLIDDGREEAVQGIAEFGEGGGHADAHGELPAQEPLRHQAHLRHADTLDGDAEQHATQEHGVVVAPGYSDGDHRLADHNQECQGYQHDPRADAVDGHPQQKGAHNVGQGHKRVQQVELGLIDVQVVHEGALQGLGVVEAVHVGQHHCRQQRQHQKPNGSVAAGLRQLAHRIIIGCIFQFGFQSYYRQIMA